MSGKSNLLKVISKQTKAETIVFDSSNHALKSLESVCDRFITEPAEFDEFIADMVPELQRRKESYLADSQISFEPILIVIDDLKQCFESASEDTAKRLEAIVRLGKGLGVNLLVAGNCDDISKMFNQGEPLTMGLVNSQVSILLGGSFRSHGVFKSNLPYSEQDVLLEDYEGYLLNKEKAMCFKAMFEN